MMGAATEKAHLPRFSLVLGIGSSDILKCYQSVQNINAINLYKTNVYTLLYFYLRNPHNICANVTS